MYSDEEQRLLNRDVLSKWRTKYVTLVDTLQHCASVCQKEGRINQIPHEYKQNKYFHSGTLDNSILYRNEVMQSISSLPILIVLVETDAFTWLATYRTTLYS